MPATFTAADRLRVVSELPAARAGRLIPDGFPTGAAAPARAPLAA